MNSPDQGDTKIRFIEQTRNKNLAKQCADKLDGITTTLFTLYQDDPIKFRMLGDKEGEDIWFFTLADNFQGFDEIAISLQFRPSEENRYYKTLSVKTGTNVSIGLYTDRETFDEYQKLHAYDWEKVYGLSLDEVKERLSDEFSEDEIDDMTFPEKPSDNYGTHYFSDLEGNFAKVVSLPEELAKGREDLEIEGHKVHGAVSVQVAMNPRDFIIYQATLTAIESELNHRIQKMEASA